MSVEPHAGHDPKVVESGINGDLLLTRVLQYDFRARKGKIIGHIRDKSKFEKVLYIFKGSF